MPPTPNRRIFVREATLDLALLLFGLFLLPVAVYWVGRLVFGDYEGDGFGAFYGDLFSRLTAGNLWAWFLILSPLIVILIARGIAWGWRATTRNAS